MTRRHGRTTCLFVLVTAVAVALAAPSGASAANKPYAVTISPGVVSAGQNVTLTATFHNTTGPPGGQQIGSANLFWPTAVFPNVTVSVPAPVTATIGASCTFGTVTGSCIQLRNMSVLPNTNLAVTIMPTAQTQVCSTTGGPGPGSWFVEAKQSNDFSGPPGNDLTLSPPPSSQLTSTLDGACHLAWNVQPSTSLTYNSSSAPLNFVTSNPLTPGTPISVSVVKSDGISAATGSIDALHGPVITLTLPAKSDPGATTPGGTPDENASGGGVASFDGLTIDEPGDGYALFAKSGSLTPVCGTTLACTTPGLSNAFKVVDKAVPCPKNNSCSVTETDKKGNGTGQVVATATGTGETSCSTNPSACLTLSVNSNDSQPLICGNYVSADQNVYEFDGPPDRSKVGTITITNPAPGSPTLAGNANQFLTAEQICFDSPTEFITASGTLAPADATGTGYIGLLPTCTGKPTGPCHNRKQDTMTPDPTRPFGFDSIVLVADIPAGPGDPHMS